MDKKLRSIIDELLDYAPPRDKELFIESRGQQVIASAIHLVRLIRESFEPEVAGDLSRRLIRAIVNEDPEKFSRRLRTLREAKKEIVSET